LSQTRWQGADLNTLVNDELAPYQDPQRLAIEGPPLVIKPAIAQNLALILHELATNAAKYGALSGMRGQLTLSWTFSGDTLELRWIESCDNPIETPARTGFGSKVIKAGIKSLAGVLTYDWRSTGLHLTMRMPARHFDLATHPVSPSAPPA